MNAAQAAEIGAFLLSAFVAVAGALGMTTTMSMFRSAIFLMASFLGVAALFILLAADLLGLLQVMMYIGGMLVMALFMVLFMHDPGGAMMAGMPQMLSRIERVFSLGLAPEPDANGAKAEAGAQGDNSHDTHQAKHGKHDGQPGEEHGRSHESDNHSQHKQSQHGHTQHGQEMDMSDMSMVTPVRPVAVRLAVALGGLLVGLFWARPNWPVVTAAPDPSSAREVGSLLMGKYMVGFEGAGLLILVGIVGATFAARSGKHGSAPNRADFIAVDAPPPPIEAEGLQPLVGVHDSNRTAELQPAVAIAAHCNAHRSHSS